MEADGAMRAAIASQGKNILQASLIEARVNEEDGNEKRAAMSGKVQKMKEDITREATLRVSAMHDREEQAALKAAAVALVRGDTTNALKVIQARLDKINRRVALRPDDSDSDLDEPASPRAAAPPSVPTHSAPPAHRTADMAHEEWESASGGNLNVGRGVVGGGGGGVDVAVFRRSLDEAGFFMAKGAASGVANVSARLMAGMTGLRGAGFPPFYIWMFDEAWGLLLDMWACAEGIMGCECVLEPTVAAYHLDYKAASGSGNKYVGTNFALPHRDYTYSDTYDADGTPQLLTVWVPCSDVTVDNGCMYVVPREFDANFDRDEAPEHMLVQKTGWLAGKSFLSFPLAGARPLAPARAGTMMGWWGNAIHWGSQCHASAASIPRASIACVFRRSGGVIDPDTPPLTRSEAVGLSSLERRRLLEASMDFFKHWSSPWDAAKAKGGGGAMTCGGEKTPQSSSA